MSLKVLIADDDRRFRKVLQRLLKDEEIEIIGEAQDGEEAIRLAQKLEPQVIVMDIGMPRMDGLEATRRIKADSPETRVIILTVHNEEVYRRAAADCGADGFVVKKSVIADLRSTVMGNG